MKSFGEKVGDEIRSHIAPAPDASGGAKKNYTEGMSHGLSRVLAEEMRAAGLAGVRAPSTGRDRSFMGGYGPKGVDVYLADERHGLLMTSGVKGLVFDPRKNLKNRYRDMVMEALELHRRFPYAVGDLGERGQSHGVVCEPLSPRRVRYGGSKPYPRSSMSRRKCCATSSAVSDV
jgi:hypothetical protein